MERICVDKSDLQAVDDYSEYRRFVSTLDCDVKSSLASNQHVATKAKFNAN